MQTPQTPETPSAAPDGDTAEFESLSVPDRATAEALGAEFEDDVQTEADHG
ncbi:MULTISPECIES: hypothetical protein [Thiomonas]|uniref:Uncharacterized protein n=1 Tax=Thiomonas arsenitoxydans (strain DSM 22701 / CIP 110005 / 3As) TaxID=426114 RepID=A0A8I1SWG2_THIA3|nr:MULTISPECIES: hypothetical protein [Thiomonas]CQR44776.1 Peptidase S9 prolyl oligopeptidase active site domain protein [Thiomonas sp. CB3]MBN8744623.1 hypothetical protein [Thiomonas arsenitoxydans]CDW92548.1 conserved hypothetical protein [Thiomonas sp. CB2]VDY05756.1 Peptidase S9 prolyl oligopeptidase active site domain protein [Thiomonas sp. Bio17B3]VDY10945.1 Peptidase S9 prolyl oligopeptidase active site domain protein [Thiomonas sp. Sup16B3]